MTSVMNQIGSIECNYRYDDIHPEKRKLMGTCTYEDCDEETTFCNVENIDWDIGIVFALRMSLCKQSPFSLLFMVKRGRVDPGFVIGIKKGKFVKFAPNQLKFPNEIYGGYNSGDNYYEGVSEAKYAYISLYRAYQEVASKYKTEPRISYEHIERDVVVSRIFSEIKNGSGKGILHKPMFVFIDFDMNTIYSFCRYNKHYDCGFENRKFLNRFAAVYLEHNNGILPKSFMSLSPSENKRYWNVPYHCESLYTYSTPKSGGCVFRLCRFFRGYNPENKTVRCGLAKAYKNYGTSEPTIVEINPVECYKLIKEKERNAPVTVQNTTKE